MLKKYEENVFLISQIFGNEPIDLSSSDSENSEPETPESYQNNEEPMKDTILSEQEIKELPIEYQQKLDEISKNRKELEQAYQKIFSEQQNLENYQGDELDSFENYNKDFHQLLHELKQSKLKHSDIENYIKRSKELGVYADTHPALLNIEGKSPKQVQRPFLENEQIQYEKL